MTTDQDDPLAKLFVDGQDLDRELLAETIYPYIRIYVGTGTPEIRLTSSGHKLTAREKLLVYLLGRKALTLRGQADFPDEDASPSEIEKETGIGGGTVRPTLKKLLDERLVQISKTGKGGYQVPNYKLHEVHDMLAHKGE